MSREGWHDQLSFKGVPLWLPVELAWGWGVGRRGAESSLEASVVSWV